MTIVISAIICTFNRDRYLGKAIQSLVEQTLETELYEIIVVDNHSTDNTKKIVTEEFAHIPNLRYIYEPVLGLSQARNTGWQNAQGEYVAYLDDDAISSPIWLEKIVEVFTQVTPKPGIVGGKIEPIWEVPRPSWLSDRVARSLTILDWSNTPGFLPDNQWLAGANIAYPKHLLKTLNGFDVNLGRKGKKLLSCEESLLNNQLKHKGYQVYYHPEIKVQHHIPASRLVKDWHYQRQYWNGISVSVVNNYKNNPSFFIRLKQAFIFTKNDLLQHLKAKRFFSIYKNEQEWFDWICFLIYKIGYLYGILVVSRA